MTWAYGPESPTSARPGPGIPPAEYSDTIHKVLGGLETSSLLPWQLGAVVAGYLGLVLFTVYLATTEVSHMGDYGRKPHRHQSCQVPSAPQPHGFFPSPIRFVFASLLSREGGGLGGVGVGTSAVCPPR